MLEIVKIQKEKVTLYCCGCGEEMEYESTSKRFCSYACSKRFHKYLHNPRRNEVLTEEKIREVELDDFKFERSHFISKLENENYTEKQKEKLLKRFDQSGMKDIEIAREERMKEYQEKEKKKRMKLIKVLKI